MGVRWGRIFGGFGGAALAVGTGYVITTDSGWISLVVLAVLLLLMHSLISREWMTICAASAAVGCILGNTHGSVAYLLIVPLTVGVVTTSSTRLHRSTTPKRPNRIGVMVLPAVLVAHTVASSIITGSPSILGLTLSLIILIVLMTYVLVGRMDGRSVGRAVEVGGVLVAIPYFLFVLSRLSEAGAGSWTKIYQNSTWLNPNSLGVFFLLCLSVPMAKLAASPPRWHALASIGVIGSACLATFSRSSAVGLTVLVLIILSRRKRLVIPIAAVAVYLIFWTPQALADRLNYTVQGGQLDDSSSARLMLWQIAEQIGLDHPILGAGLPSLGESLGPYATDKGIQFAHNTALTLFAAFGAPIALTCAIMTGRLLIRLMKGVRRPEAAPRHLAALGGISGLVVASMFGEPILSPPVAFLAAALVSNAFAEKEIRREPEDPPNIGYRRRWQVVP